MLQLLPHEDLEKLLAELPCLICNRRLGDHTEKELETCRAYAEERWK
jgi:hypothetical protein